MSKNLDILYITDYFSIYLGGTRVLFLIISNLEKKYKIGIVTRYTDIETFQKLRNMNNVSLFSFNKKLYKYKEPSIFDLMNFIVYSLKVILHTKPSVLHLQVHIPNLFAYIFPHRSIVTIWHLDTFVGALRKHRALGKLVQTLELLAPARFIHVIDKYTMTILTKKFHRSNVILIPPIVMLNKKMELTDNKKDNLIVMIGNLNWRKNYTDMIIATYLLRKFYFDEFKLLIIGNGELYNYLKSLIKKLNLDDTVFILTNISDDEKYRYLSRAKVLVHLGFPEGFGLVVCEGYLSKSCVITYDVPPFNEMPEVIYKVPYKNIGELARVLHKVLTNGCKKADNRCRYCCIPNRTIISAFEKIYTTVMHNNYEI
jgi:glycosyltransferase involved in cell wall biosynthesis